MSDQDTTQGEQIEQPPEIYKVIGAPGTGKTTRVVGNVNIEDHTSLVQENMDEYPLHQQMIVTYTNAAVDEAADRLYNLTDNYKYEIEERVTTIHSRCFQMLDLDRDQVVQFYHKQNFCDAYDLEFGYEDDDGGDVMSADKAEGNALFELYGWLQSNLLDLEEYEQFPRDPPDIDGVLDHLKLWEAYKADRGLVGFGDMIERVIAQARDSCEHMAYGPLFPDEDMGYIEFFEEVRDDPGRNRHALKQLPGFIDTEVLYVDEVQDLTPLQWAWYLAQSCVSEKVYIGGDDDQCIYSWGGADPNFMLDEEGDFEVLDRTYRIPEEIWDVCNNTIQQVERRQSKDVTPDGDGGEVVKLRSPSPREVIQHFDAEETFVLFRANYMIDEFTDVLHEQGIPYRNESTFDIWTTEVQNVASALTKIAHNLETLDRDELSALKENVPNRFVNDGGAASKEEEVMNSFSGTTPKKARERFDFPSVSASRGFTWEAYLHQAKESDNLNYYECEAIKGIIHNKTHELDPEKVTLGTIHSAKGREAPNVVLALDTTQSIAEAMRDDIKDKPGKTMSDSERRVYYVGMSRASEKLVLAEGLVDAEMTIEIPQLIGETGYDNVERTQRQSSMADPDDPNSNVGSWRDSQYAGQTESR